jgi:sulfofructose kinase
MTGRIVCVGAVVHDDVYHVERLPAAGIKIAASRHESRFGGPAATAAVAIANMHGAASYWGRVGADAAGDAARRALARHGVECDGIAVVQGGRTRSAVVLVDQNGERCIVAYRKGLPDDATLLPDDPLDGVAAVLVDSRWVEGAETVVLRARAKGIASVIDVDGGVRSEMAQLIDKADHIVFSAEGLRDFAGDGSQPDQLRKCATSSSPSKVFAVTRGAAGSLWLLNGELTSMPAFEVAVADTTGCGDVFHGAYALALAEGQPPLDAARFASATAAIKANRGRGWDGMPDRRAVMELLAAGLA